MKLFEKDFLDFFKELAANNNKDWFDINRKRYETNIKNAFKTFVEAVIERLSKHDDSLKDLEAKNCIFRINRDIRFSNDKSPYKLHSSAVIGENGKKTKSGNGIYLELSPEHFRIYGGIYEINKDDLLIIREGIADNMNEFRKLYSDKKFKQYFGEIRGEKNKIIPKHLKEAAEREPLIFNKQFYFFRELPAETILNDNLVDTIEEVYTVIKPIQDFFTNILK